MINEYFRKKFKGKNIYFILSLLICYSILEVYNSDYLAMTASQIHQSFFLANYESYFSKYAITFVILPIYLLYQKENNQILNQYNILIRFSDFKRYWKNRVLILIIESVIFVSTLYVLLIFRAIYFHDLDKIYQNYSNIINCFFCQTVGFIYFGLIFAFFTTLFSSVCCGFCFTYGLIVFEYFSNPVFGIKIIIFNIISISPNNANRIVWLYVILLFLFILLTQTLLMNVDNLKRRVD